jgi:hypothetical protein
LTSTDVFFFPAASSNPSGWNSRRQVSGDRWVQHQQLRFAGGAHHRDRRLIAVDENPLAAGVVRTGILAVARLVPASNNCLERGKPG